MFQLWVIAMYQGMKKSRVEIVYGSGKRIGSTARTAKVPRRTLRWEFQVRSRTQRRRVREPGSGGGEGRAAPGAVTHPS